MRGGVFDSTWIASTMDCGHPDVSCDLFFLVSNQPSLVLRPLPVDLCLLEGVGILSLCGVEVTDLMREWDAEASLVRKLEEDAMTLEMEAGSDRGGKRRLGGRGLG